MGSEFERIDHHALGTPSSVTRSVDALASYLVRPAGTDLEKARSLFRWIAASCGSRTHRGPTTERKLTRTRDVIV